MKKAILLTSLFLCVFSIFSQTNEKRIALVIGNSAYLDGKAIKNPVNDAELMATTLQNLNFTVIKKINLNREEMLQAIADFASNLANYNVALVFYSGQGMQIKGINYLIPVDAKLDSVEMLSHEAVSENDTISKFEGYPKNVNILIMDASRNNPFTKNFRDGGNKGLAQLNVPEGTIIAYATSPGSVVHEGSGQNGLFTQELVKAFNKPGLEIEEIFEEVRYNVYNLSEKKQTPWVSSTFAGKFYFRKK